MSAVALRCDADADRMLAHLRERFAEVFPVTGSAGDGAGGDAGGNPDEGADGSADAAVRFAPVADRGSFAFASAPGRLEEARCWYSVCSIHHVWRLSLRSNVKWAANGLLVLWYGSV